MDSKFNVVYTGQLQEGVEADEFVEKFCHKFGISEQKARQIANSISEVVIKKELDEKKAKKYLAALEACGMVARMDEIGGTPASSGLSLETIKEEDGDDGRTNTAPVDANNDNPYAPPEASLERNTLSKDGQGSLEGGINGDYDFTIGDILSEAWEKTSGAKGTFLLAWVFYTLVAVAMNMILKFIAPDVEILFQEGRMTEGMIWSIMPILITMPILYTITAGITLLGIHRSVDADISATSVFSHFGRIIPLTILAILMTILIMMGFIVLIIPGIYLSIAYTMALALMMDKDLGVWTALEVSRKAVSKHWFKVFLLYLLLMGIMLLAYIPLFIGLIWALPLFSIAQGVLYKYMFGVDSAN